MRRGRIRLKNYGDGCVNRFCIFIVSAMTDPQKQGDRIYDTVQRRIAVCRIITELIY